MGQRTAGTRGGRDRLGVLSTTRSWHVDTFDEVWTVGDTFVSGVPEVDRSFSQVEADTELAGWIVEVFYEGLGDGGKEDKVITNYDRSFSQEKIETHWDLENIIKKFGGYYEGRDLLFPRLIPDGAGSLAGGFTKGVDAKVGDKNPMHGVRTYPLEQLVYNRSYVRRTFPHALTRQLDKIVTRPPGIKGSYEKRNFKFSPPQIIERGDVVEVRESWKLSPPGGWNPALSELISGTK
ncbi:MAG: hypothetical protein QM496_01905 [Verrucomicrobiota bacterium]